VAFVKLPRYVVIWQYLQGCLC